MTTNPKLLFLSILMASAPTVAQDAASRASSASIDAFSAVPAASLELVAAGGAFSVAAIRPVAHGIEVVLLSAASGAEFVVHVSTETAQAASIVVGTAVEISATTAGFLIVSAGVAIAFVPNALVAGMIHHSEIHHREIRPREIGQREPRQQDNRP